MCMFENVRIKENISPKSTEQYMTYLDRRSELIEEYIDREEALSLKQFSQISNSVLK